MGNRAKMVNKMRGEKTSSNGKKKTQPMVVTIPPDSDVEVISDGELPEETEDDVVILTSEDGLSEIRSVEVRRQDDVSLTIFHTNLSF